MHQEEEEAVVALEVEILAQEEEQGIAWQMREVEEVVAEVLTIFQTLAPPLLATQALSDQGCTRLCPPAPRSLQEGQARTNTYLQFSPPLS